MNSKRHTELSRALSRVLRHAPEEYGLTLDADGWVACDDLIAAFKARHAKWSTLELDDLAHVVENGSKKRHEIKDGYIRAMYGHSVETTVALTPTAPPPVLYHGTSPKALTPIRTQGLQPMGRQRVHLSLTRDIAIEVGRRKAKTPVILEVDAAAASAGGVVFYLGNDDIWLADRVPAEFIRFPA